jgi:glycine C-acetyltransferase
VDIFEKFRENSGPLGQYKKEAHGYYTFPQLEGEIAPRMNFRGKSVLTWSLNNYLGLANHPEVRKADAEAAKDWGLAYPMGARIMTGQTKYHVELENELAEFVGKKYAYLLNFGYQGMISIIDSLTSRKDVIVYDSESHACILDGLRLSFAKRFVYPHNDMEKLERELHHAQKWVEKTGGGILVITEGVFGMAGDLGNLKAITDLKEKFEFRLLIDDAHGFGTMGPKGNGTDAHFGVQDKVDIYFGTFAKSMAGIGAFVATNDEDAMNFLQYNLRSQVFAKSLPMPLVFGLKKRLELIKTQPELKTKLWKVVEALQKALTLVLQSRLLHLYI